MINIEHCSSSDNDDDYVFNIHHGVDGQGWAATLALADYAPLLLSLVALVVGQQQPVHTIGVPFIF